MADISLGELQLGITHEAMWRRPRGAALNVSVTGDPQVGAGGDLLVLGEHKGTVHRGFAGEGGVPDEALVNATVIDVRLGQHGFDRPHDTNLTLQTGSVDSFGDPGG